MVMLLTLTLYLVIGVLLDFYYQTFVLDSVTRLANGFYVLYSRDPHLAAVGFVWDPGSSIADDIPLLFYHLWTPLATHIFAATLTSSAAMAGMVYQAWCTFKEWGVTRAPRLVIVVILALNGMILYYGANGMSEALYLFTLVATCRYLLRWLRDDDLTSLVYAGVSLGVCYLVRNEAAFPAVLAGVVVLVVGIIRRPSPRSRRIWGALLDLTLFEMPFVTSFAGWAVASYVIVGQPFQRISIATNVPTAVQQSSVLPPFGQRITIDAHDVLWLAPTLGLLVAAAVIVAVGRRDMGLLAPLTVVGGGLLFSLFSFADGLIPDYLRYYIASVPLEVLIAGSLFATAPAVVGAPHRSEWSAKKGLTQRRLTGAAAALLAIILLAPSEVTTAKAMFNPQISPEEANSPRDRLPQASQSHRSTHPTAKPCRLGNLELPRQDAPA